jgi:chromosome segregation ATPase
MTTERLERIETDLEAVKELLASTAGYVESAHANLNQLSQRLDDLTTLVVGLTQQHAQSTSRLDEYIYQSQRLLTQTVERSTQKAGRIDCLEGVMAMLTRLHDRQQAQLENQQAQLERRDGEFAEHQRTTDAALERIDRLLDYLIRRDQDTGDE